VTHVWIDLANSPHVAMFEPIVTRLADDGHEVLLTARDHAQTLELALDAFGEDAVNEIGRRSPPGRVAKGVSIGRRAQQLRSYAHDARPDLALSHGSYAQILAARSARIPVVTMMDYEFQPANHLSFRLAQTIVVPEVFPSAELRRQGGRERKVIRYAGFKEELYLGRFEPDQTVLAVLGLDPVKVIVVLRPPPEGALYHRSGNDAFEDVFEEAALRDDLEVVVLPRSSEQAEKYRGRRGVHIPERAVPGRDLLACADVMIGAGGTMNREAALLGTPTYTMFAGKLAAVDAELISMGLMHDLRHVRSGLEYRKKPARDVADASARSDAIMETIVEAVLTTVGRRQQRAS
jgi:predicted glycosyltransferase